MTAFRHRSGPTGIRNRWLALLAAVLAPAVTAQEYVPPPPAEWPEPVMDDLMIGKLLVDRLERSWNDGAGDTLIWDATGWYGGDYNRLWVKTEGRDRIGADSGELEAELLYGRLVAPFWDLQAGLGYERRYGSGPNPDRVSAVIGFQGLAPYWFEIDSALRISEDGDVSASLEAEYDLLLGQRLILQPRFATAIAAQEVEAFEVGQGIQFVELGLRLRYEIRREIAPYVGLSWTRKLGDTADMARADGEDVEMASVVAGIRFWF